MLKIPFAVESCSGELIEVGQVRSGRETGCVCPSCGQSVIARKGNINQWHFAHDRRSAIPPHTLCEVSFYACCRRFVIEQLIKKNVSTLSTPSYTISDKILVRASDSLKSLSGSVTVTDSRTVFVDSFCRSGKFDIAAIVGSHIIDIVLHYPTRLIPQVDATSDAILMVDLKFIAERYESARSSPELIQQAISDLFGVDVAHKRWLFHPRELSMREQLREKLNAEFKNTETLVDKSIRAAITQAKTLRCMMCNGTWRWTTGEPYLCKRCNTHLYIISDT